MLVIFIHSFSDYDIQISPDVEGPIITDWSLRSNPSDISIVAFIKVPSDLTNTSTIFSLTPSQNNGNAMVTASFGCNAFNVYMTTQEDVSKREKRYVFNRAYRPLFKILTNSPLDHHQSNL